MAIRNKMYKEHLARECKTERDIFLLILKDCRRGHKAALELMKETTHEVFTARTVEIATKLVVNQMGLFKKQ